MKFILSFCISTILLLTGCGLSERPQTKKTISPEGDPAGKLDVAHWVKGKSVDISQGVNVVEFWATWCPPCRTSIPHLSKTQAKYKDREVNIIGITNEPLETVEPFVKRMGQKMEYSVAIDNGRATSKEFMERYNVRGIPHAFVVKNGKVLWHGHPMDNLEEAIDNALK